MPPVDPAALPGTRLPPDGQRPATVLAVPGAVAKRYDVRDVIADAIAAVGPDVIVATPPDSARAALGPVARLANVPVVDPSRSLTYHAANTRVSFVTAPTPERLPPTPSDVPQRTQEDGAGDPEHYYLVSDRLELTVDPHRRETRLEGIEEYLDGLPKGWHGEAAVTHVSTGVRAAYQTRYETATGAYPVHGAGPPTSSVGAAIDESDRPLVELSVYSNGAVRATTHDPTNFGLRGLAGVGPRKADRLRDHGLDSRGAVVEATPRAIAEIRGFGGQTAETVHRSARAVATGEVVPGDGGTLPSGDPVFVDVETNGLNGDIAWLVGVLDGGPEGQYLPFRQREREDTAEHVDAFMSWLTGVAGGRPVVAWNGYDFDFPVIRRHLERDAPEWIEDWEARYQFDPLYYAATQRHATLPGRSNRLEAVATALGWEPTTTGVDGATAAREYNAWRRTADRPDEYRPDWERLEAYCEDDVRALATIYEALRDANANRRPPETTSRPADRSRQGSLSEFS